MKFYIFAKQVLAATPLSEVPASLWGPFFKWLPGKIQALHSPIFDMPLTSAFINPDRILRQQCNQDSRSGSLSFAKVFKDLLDFNLSSKIEYLLNIS